MPAPRVGLREFAFLLIIVLVALPVAANAAEDAVKIGVVDKVENEAKVVSGDNAAAAIIGTPIHMRDELRTGAEGRLKIIFRDEKGDPAKIAERTREYEERFANPFVAASKGFIDEVIMPHSTRRRVALGLRKLRDKQLENPWKKHDNIPL